MVKILNNQSLKYKATFLTLLISFIAVITGLYFVKNITANIKESRTRIAEVERDNALVDKILRDTGQNSTKIENIKSTLPSEYYEISFFSMEIERLSTENGLASKINIDQKKKVEPESYDSVIFSIELTGNYLSVSNFMDQLAKLPYNTSVDYLKMSNNEGELMTNVKLRLFTQK